jgi:uncharacterized LabA/DUF88 family protein
VTQPDRLRLAVFIDFDNIEIGVKNTVGASFDAGLVLEALKERGEVVAKTAYSDWQRAAAGYSRLLTQHAIRMVQRNVTPGGDKNGADINLALDALEMAFTHPHINAFVIVGGDSDFISLVEKLKQYDKKVFVVGGRQFTSQILQRNCHEFIAYENLAAPAPGRRAAGPQGRVERLGIDQAIPLVRRALGVLAEREVSPQLGLLKSTLLQLDSTFSERSYGAGSFRDFAHKLEQAGVLKVHQAKGGWLVALPDGAGNGASAPVGGETPAVESEAAADRPPVAAPDRRGAPAQIGTAADGVREIVRLLASAEVRRWPLYLRHVKQILKKANAGFDERAYGFATLIDLLRAANREGVLRVERDRQGGLLVFQPAAVAAPAPAIDVEPEAPVAVDVEPATEVVSEPEQPALLPDVAPSEPPRVRRSRTRSRATTEPRAPRPRAKRPRNDRT